MMTLLIINSIYFIICQDYDLEENDAYSTGYTTYKATRSTQDYKCYRKADINDTLKRKSKQNP
jgi:hypothetical protein